MVIKETEPVSLCGVTIGEVVWCKLTTGNIGHGRIVLIHPKNKEGPAMTIFDEFSGAYRVSLISSITEGDKSKINKLAKARAKRAQKESKK
jgi:hypothetical protein